MSEREIVCVCVGMKYLRNKLSHNIRPKSYLHTLQQQQQQHSIHSEINANLTHLSTALESGRFLGETVRQRRMIPVR